MKTPIVALLSALCLGCAPAAPPQAATPVDVAAVQAVRPAGPYAVGVAAGPVLPSGGATRLYYPADEPGPGAAGGFTADHVANLSRRFGGGVGEGLSAAVTAARPDAPAAPGRFPAVVFQPGASMAATDYRLLIEDLVSRGYVVLALNPEGSPPLSGDRYAQAARESAEAAALIRAGGVSQADPEKIALMGHSLGGAASILALAQVPGAVGVNLDGDYGVETRAPAGAALLHLMGQTEGEADRSRARRAQAWADTTRAAADPVVLQVVTLKHFDFADAALLQDAIPAERRRSRFGAVGGPAAHALTTDLVAAFLDSRLKGQVGAWPSAVARHPEATAPSTW